MTKIDRVLKKLSELYELNRKLKAYKLKEKASKPLKEGSVKDSRAPLSEIVRPT
ncbi:MAG: hypothetical protein AB9873_01750 [Syntrophobacteraceae bacterium]